MESKRRSGVRRLAKLIPVVFFCGFLVSLFSTIAVFSAANIFQIQNVELSELSEDVEGSIDSFDETNIVSSVTFHKLDDSAKYTITLKNTDSKDHVIESITNDNENPYITFEHDSYADTTVGAGENLVFAVTAKYTNAVTDMSQRVQVADVKFKIQYADIAESESFTLSPNTGDRVIKSIVCLVVAALGLTIFAIVFAKNRKAMRKYVAVLAFALAAVTIASIVKATTAKTDGFTLSSNYGLYDKLIVHYGDNDFIVNYGDKLEEIEEPSEAGQAFAGWMDEEGDDIDSSKPITEDITIFAKWEAQTFGVTLNANGRSFSDGSSVNQVKLSGACGDNYTRPLQKYSHTPNINDAGERDGNYGNYMGTIDIVSFPGAAKLHLTINYGTQQYNDYLHVLKGEYVGPVQRVMSGTAGSYTGGQDDARTVSLDITGDTVSFVFYSDYKTEYYGYYAIVEAYDANNNIIGNPVADCDREIASGEYKDLSSGNYIFKGWSEDQNAEAGLYSDMSDIHAHLPGEIGEKKTLYAIWEQLYDISYDGNSNTVGTMEGVVHNDLHSGDYFYLDAPNYLREDYGFVGWSQDKNAVPGGNAVIYGPNEFTTIDQRIKDHAADDGNIVMYAIWLPKSTTYTLQTFNKTAFEMTNPNTTFTALTDTRDGQTYAVAKLADGKWWMLESLRFDPAGKELTSENTNNPTAAFANTVKNRTVSEHPTTCSDEESASCINRYSIITTDIKPDNTPSPTQNGAQNYSYGVHYNWYSATAGNGTYNTTNYAEAAGDICPSGWQLPANRANSAELSDFSQLDLALGGNGSVQYTDNDEETLTSFPNNFTRSGKALSENNPVIISQRGKIGQYWGRTSWTSVDSASYYSVAIWANDEHFSSQGYLTKSVYLPIRCLAK